MRSPARFLTFLRIPKNDLKHPLLNLFLQSIAFFLFLLSRRGVHGHHRLLPTTAVLVIVVTIVVFAVASSLLSPLELFKLFALHKQEVRCCKIVQAFELVPCCSQPLIVVHHHLYVVQALLFDTGRSETDLIVRQPVLIVGKQCELLE